MTGRRNFQRFNPDLQKRNLENRERRQQDFDDFVMRLKEYSKSDKPSMLLPFANGNSLGDSLLWKLINTDIMPIEQSGR